MTDMQLWAASVLVTTIEAILRDGLIVDEQREMRTRIQLTNACRHLGLDTIAERPAGNVLPFARAE